MDFETKIANLQELAKQRVWIDKIFGGRFYEERKIKEFNGHKQGTWVKVDFSKMATKKWKYCDELLIIGFVKSNSTFIGMAGSMDIVQAPISTIIK